MDTLPPELHLQILTYLPKSSLPTCRLISHSFAALAFPLVFSHLHQWLDYEISHRSIISLAHDAYNRPAVMWSPWATGPDGAVDEVFMGLVWRLIVKREIPDGGIGFERKRGVGAEVDEENEGEEGTRTKDLRNGKRDVIRLTAANFAELSGREEMTENRLRTGQNRFLLHKSYTEEGLDERHWSAF